MCRNFRSITGVFMVAALIAAAACDRGAERTSDAGPTPDGPKLSARPADAPRAEPESPREFAYVRYHVEVDGAAPAACLTFTAPLDPSVDYSPYVRLSPSTPTALDVDGRALCVGGLTFGEPRELTVLEGLPAADGRKLAASETTTIEFGDRPAYVGFKGGGVILPRKDADGLALETVNIDAVDIKVWRVTDRALAFKRVSQGYTASEDDWAWLPYDEDPSDVAVLAWRGEMATPSSPNAPTVTVFPIAKTIDRLSAGAYFVEVADASAGDDDRRPAHAKRWLIVTDLGLTAYTSSDTIDVMVRSLQDAKPVANARIEIVARSNEILATAQTDGKGHVRVAGAILRGDGAAAPRMVMAYGQDGDFAILDLDRAYVDLSGHDVGGRAAPTGADAFVYLDRGIYRPGETVRATALLRDAGAVSLAARAGALIVYGPNGIEAERRRFSDAPKAGGVTYDYAVPNSAARGQWRIDVELDGLGRVGATSFAVEDFVPQRVALTLEADADTPLARGDTRAIEADVRFLYGAPGAGLPIEGQARIEVDPRPFDAFADYSFGRQDEQFREAGFDLDSTFADGAGHAALAFDPGRANVSSSKPLRARVVIAAVEPGGRAVRDDVRIPYRTESVYLGLDPQFDGRAPMDDTFAINAVAVAASGEQAAARVAWRLVRNDWTYDWYRTDFGEWRWRRSREIVAVTDGVADLAGDAPTPIRLSDLDWGDYELFVDDAESGASASHSFWVGWGAQPEDGVQAPDRVRVSGPADAPKIGGRAEITILPPYAGEAEVVVANDTVIETRTVSVPSGGARVRLDVTKEWGVGAYVMVNVFTPRDAVDQPTPRRAVGVIHVPVDTSDRTFELSMTAPAVARPREALTVDLAAVTGPIRENAFVSVAAVDEGILQLTKFESPDPTGWYFGQKRLAIELHDDYGRLLDPNQGAAAPVRSGGDQIGGAGLSVVPTKSVALYSGPVQLDGRGRAQITFDVPDFNGELRLMAVAWSASGVGATAQPLTVRDKVPAEVILPRFLAPGDEAVATASLDNVEGAAGDYVADIGAEGAVSTAGDERLTLRLASGEREDSPVRLAAGEEGLARIAIAVAGPEGFSVSRDYPIQVRSPYLPTANVERVLMAPGAAYTPPTDLLASFVAGSGGVNVSFSAIPMDAGALLDSLDRYPYGCTEQITSRAMPLIYAGQMAALAGRDDDAARRSRIQDAVSTILNRQSADGALGLWRVGDRSATPWLGAYAVDFLARAKAEGYVVPDAALDRAYGALESVAQQEYWYAAGYDAAVQTSPWNVDTQEKMNDRSSAYAAYVLARVGRMDRSRLRYLHDERLTAISSPLARAHLGAALAFIGDRARATSAFAAAEQSLGYSNTGDWYQTPRRDLAGVLALAGEAGLTDVVERLEQRLSDDLPEPDRLTTQEKSFLLLAAHALAGDGGVLDVRADGAAMTRVAGASFAMDAAGLANGATFTNTRATPVWRTTVARGAPVTAPPAAENGIAVAKNIRRTDGSAADLDAVKQGDRLIVSITLHPRQRRAMPAIVADLLPAGFEIETVLNPGDAGETGPYAWLGDLAQAKITEARDDRFVAAVDLMDQQPVTLAYLVRAVTPGRFALPGAVVEDMYRPSVFGRSEAGTVAVASGP